MLGKIKGAVHGYYDLVNLIISSLCDYVLFIPSSSGSTLAKTDRGMSEMNVSLPLTLSSVTIESCINSVGRLVVRILSICFGPSTRMLTVVSRWVCAMMLRYTYMDRIFHKQCEYSAFLLNVMYISTMRTTTLVLNSIMFLMTLLIIITVLFTLLLTPFVPIVLVVTILITLLIAFSLITVITEMTSALTKAMSAVRKTLGLILLASVGSVSMVVASLTSCAAVLCWIVMISSMQVICFALSAFMILTLFTVVLVLTIIRKVMESEDDSEASINVSEQEEAKLSLKFHHQLGQ